MIGSFVISDDQYNHPSSEELFHIGSFHYMQTQNKDNSFFGYMNGLHIHYSHS